MFSINEGKVFKIKLENGCTVSVQMGAENYCDNRNKPQLIKPREVISTACSNAEVGVFNPEGKPIIIREIYPDDVWIPDVTPAQLIEILNIVAKITEPASKIVPGPKVGDKTYELSDGHGKIIFADNEKVIIKFNNGDEDDDRPRDICPFELTWIENENRWEYGDLERK